MAKLKQKISISVDEETLSKIDEGIVQRKFRNRSHAFEYALMQVLQLEEKA